MRTSAPPLVRVPAGKRGRCTVAWLTDPAAESRVVASIAWERVAGDAH
jgi:hypothetical protein